MPEVRNLAKFRTSGTEIEFVFFYKPLPPLGDECPLMTLPDRDRINVIENCEVEYLTKKLGALSENLKKAVSISITDVEAYLNK